jgi:hypothetical protein
MVVGRFTGGVELRAYNGDLVEAFDAPDGFTTIMSIAYDDQSASVVAADFGGRFVAWRRGASEPFFGPTAAQVTNVATLIDVEFALDRPALIVSDFYGGMVELPWRLAEWERQLCNVAGRNLTQAEWTKYLPTGEPYRATCPAFPARE